MCVGLYVSVCGGEIIKEIKKWSGLFLSSINQLNNEAGCFVGHA